MINVDNGAQENVIGGGEKHVIESMEMIGL